MFGCGLNNVWRDRIAEFESENAMSVQNLAIVFGPTLFKQAQSGMNGNINGMADAGLQNKARSSTSEHPLPSTDSCSL